MMSGQSNSRPVVGMLATVGSLAALLIIGGPALASPFGAPVALSINGHANSASVAIDEAGDATAVWADGALFYSDHPAGGGWTTASTFNPGSGAGSIAGMHMSATGNATTVTYGNLYGIYADDRPAGGNWGGPTALVNAPQLIAPLYTGAPTVIFLENSSGDQAVIFEQISNGAQVISALRRPSGGAWTAAETVASSATSGDIDLAGASIGEGGDVLVTFETYQVSCSRYCHQINYVVHASREPAAGDGWADSGPLTSAGSVWRAGSAIDPSGSAVVLYQPDVGSTITAVRQGRAGERWSSPVTAYSSSAAYLMGVEAGSRGRASFFTGFGGILDVDGLLGSNSWSAPVNLAAGDTSGAVPQIAYGATPAGGVAVAWADGDGTVRATTRASARKPWAATQTLAPAAACNIGGVVCNGAAAAAINARGQAAALFINLDPSVTVHTLYAATN